MPSLTRSCTIVYFNINPLHCSFLHQKKYFHFTNFNTKTNKFVSTKNSHFLTVLFLTMIVSTFYINLVKIQSKFPTSSFNLLVIAVEMNTRFVYCLFIFLNLPLVGSVAIFYPHKFYSI